jgi:hypothetical protein
LADAFAQAESAALSNPSGIVNVTISSKSAILFKNTYPETPPGGWTTEMWHQQRDDADKWELASIIFLRDFEDFIMSYLK